MSGNLTLTRQDLPQANICLEGAESVAVESGVGDFPDAFSGCDELHDGLVGQVGKLGEDEIPVAEQREFAGQDLHRVRRERRIRGAPAINLRCGQIELQRAGVRASPREGGHGLDDLFRRVKGTVMPVPVIDDAGAGFIAENVLPDRYATWNVGFSVCLPRDPGIEDEEIGCLTENSDGSTLLRIGRPEGLIEFLEAWALGEVVPLVWADAAQNVEVGCEPSVILLEQTGYEVRRRVGTCSRECFPCGFGVSTSRDENTSVVDADLTSVEIEGGGEWKESAEAWGALKRGSCDGIGLRQSPVKAGDRWIVDHDIEKVAVRYFLAAAQRAPITLVEENWEFC